MSLYISPKNVTHHRIGRKGGRQGVMQCQTGGREFSDKIMTQQKPHTKYMIRERQRTGRALCNAKNRVIKRNETGGREEGG
jgi:hypothetical protein